MEFWRIYRIIRRRRWLILLGTLVCVGVVAWNILMTPPSYIGRTTLMESTGMSHEGVPLYPEQMIQLDMRLKLSNLGVIATSERVLTNAVSTLSDLGVHETPEEILAATSVQPVKDTNILAVEVTLPARDTSEDAKRAAQEDAKVAADVVAAEFKRAYAELNNSAVRQSREFIEAQLETAKKSMVSAQDALKQYKEKYEIAQIDQQAMTDVQRLAQAKTEMERAKTDYESRVARLKQLTDEYEQLKPHEWEVVSEATEKDPKWQQAPAAIGPVGDPEGIHGQWRSRTTT